MRRDFTCVLCGNYTVYAAEDSGFGEIAGQPVRIEEGDPVCLTHEAYSERGGFIRVVKMQKLEPGRIQIGEKVVTQ